MPNLPSADIIICRLPQHSLLSISSADNLKFLQGQFTCDVREVCPGQWRYGALCTSKGRMISNFLLIQVESNQHILRLHHSTLEAVHDTLKKFAPFYKGILTNVTGEYVLMGVAGKHSTALVQSVFSLLPDQNNRMAQNENTVVIRLDEQRYECWVKASQAEICWEQLRKAASLVTESSWDLLNIRAGVGEVRQATIEAWTPHMLNLQAVGAISFKKGCYTGQEIVARTEYRGHQKRAMHRIAGAGPAPIEAAAVLDGEQAAGEIVMASPTAGDRWEALAVIGDAHVDKPLTCLGAPVRLLDLPYAIERK